MQVMILVQNLLKGERNYACHVTEYIISICTPYIIGGYVKVHDHHPHKQHTIDFINSVVKNSYYKENRTLQLVPTLILSVDFTNMLRRLCFAKFTISGRSLTMSYLVPLGNH